MQEQQAEQSLVEQRAMQNRVLQQAVGELSRAHKVILSATTLLSTTHPLVRESTQFKQLNKINAKYQDVISQLSNLSL